MRYTLGILVATTTLLFAAGCGAESPDTATDQPSDKPSSSSADVVAILSGTAEGGQTTEVAVDLGTPAGVDRLVADLSRDTLANQVRAKVADTDVPDGRRLVGAVISIGCDTPVDVKVFEAAGGPRLEPIFAGEPMKECFAAVTSIALVLVEA